MVRYGGTERKHAMKRNGAIDGRNRPNMGRTDARAPYLAPTDESAVVRRFRRSYAKVTFAPCIYHSFAYCFSARAQCVRGNPSFTED